MIVAIALFGSIKIPHSTSWPMDVMRGVFGLTFLTMYVSRACHILIRLKGRRVFRSNRVSFVSTIGIAHLPSFLSSSLVVVSACTFPVDKCPTSAEPQSRHSCHHRPSSLPRGASSRRGSAILLLSSLDILIGLESAFSFLVCILLSFGAVGCGIG